MAANANPHEAVARIQTIGPREITDKQRIDAANVIDRLAARHLERRDQDIVHDRADVVRHALPALGLIDPLITLPELPDPSCRTASARAAHAVHGTQEGYRWHLAQRIPLCSPCRAWGHEHGTGGR